MVDPCAVVLDQIVLDRNDAEVSDGGLGRADEIPCELAVIGEDGADVAAGKIAVRIRDGLDPAAGRLVVVSACVDDTVVVIIMREIVALLT